MTSGLGSDASPAAGKACFHCGEAVSGRVAYHARIADIERPMCCAGCKAVAEAIMAAGLGTYYQRRSQPGRQAGPQDGQDILAVLDSPAYQNAVVQVRAMRLARHRCSKASPARHASG